MRGDLPAYSGCWVPASEPGRGLTKGLQRIFQRYLDSTLQEFIMKPNAKCLLRSDLIDNQFKEDQLLQSIPRSSIYYQKCFHDHTSYLSNKISYFFGSQSDRLVSDPLSTTE